MRHWQLQELISVLNAAETANIALRAQVMKNNHFISEDNFKICLAEILPSKTKKKLKDLQIDKMSALHKLCNLLCHSLDIDRLKESKKTREALRLELVNFVNLKTEGEPLAIPKEILDILTSNDLNEANKLIEKANSYSKKIAKCLNEPLEHIEHNSCYYSLEKSAMVYFAEHLKVTPNNDDVKEKMTNQFINDFLNKYKLEYKPLYIHKETLNAYIEKLPDPFTGREKTKKKKFTQEQNSFFRLGTPSLSRRSVVRSITHSGANSHNANF